MSFKYSEPWDASLETNLKLALSNPGPSHSQDHKELRSAVLFRGGSVAPYFTQLLVALASGTSVPDVCRSLQRADCLACSFFSDLLTGLSQTWCGCSAVYGERVVIKTSLELNQFVSQPARDACAWWFSTCRSQQVASSPACCPVSNCWPTVQLNWSYWGCPFATPAGLPCLQFKSQHQVDLVAG